MSNEEAENNEEFDFCNNVDLHILDIKTSLNSVVAVAGEHAFRGIVVPLGRLEQLVSCINKPLLGCKKILPICMIDYPSGSSSLDVRNYMIMAAKEKGAKEVEIVAPYQLIVEKEFRKIHDDISGLNATAVKMGITLKYVLDQNNEILDDGVRTKICRILSSNKVPILSTSLGYFDGKLDHTDNILKMRGTKAKLSCKMKTYINNCSIDELSLYIKAGCDIIGLDWKNAPRLVHGYKALVKTQNN